MTGTHLRRWLCLGMAASVLAALVAAPSSGIAREAPAGARAWLGSWTTNFGALLFYDLSYTDVTWDHTGAEVSTCVEYRHCEYHWLLRGMWRWPGHGWVPLKGTPTGTDDGTLEPCWLGPFSLEVPGSRGNACYSMLLYRFGDAERGGFWKACFLPENCTDHHHLHGAKHGPAWVSGFRFTQRGRPDGHTTIRTQTGGAGSVIWDEGPVANRHGGTRGHAAPGSGLFAIDEISGAQNLHITVELREGRRVFEGLHREQLVLAGLITSSDDPHCRPGKLAGLWLTDGQRGLPDRIRLSISGCREEQWTSTDRARVSVHIDRAHKVG